MKNAAAFGSGIFRALGDSKRPLYFLMFSAGANVVMTLLFVAVLDWGIAGAAWATIIGQAVSFLFSLFYLYRNREAFGFDAFAFISVDFTKIDGIGEVNFLLTIPIHKEEREWIMETDTFEGHLMLEEVFGKQLYFADSGRNAFIPDEQTIQDLK